MPNDPFYSTAKYKRWRHAVLRKAGFLCAECRKYGRRTEATHAHHILPRKDFPDKAYDVSNGLALCTACHNKLEPRSFTSRRKKI